MYIAHLQLLLTVMYSEDCVHVHVTVHEISGSYITCYSCFVQVFQEYFKEMEEESIRDNFVIIYELMDELMDYGYPQTTESKILKE